ncbi:hypothetical protein BJ742DRAFT_779923 [Cladochytrium replicatum]|nr:hypothetical protein BJ742DRAFT_779923 [Cladochytrium replicatum]
MASIAAAQPTAVKALALSTALIFVKFFLVTMVQGGKRFRAGTRPPEDAVFKGLAGKTQQTFGVPVTVSGSEQDKLEKIEKARLEEIRWTRLVQNDLENAYPGLIIGAISIICNGNETVNVVALAVFTAARLFHTYAYASALQPHRAIAYGVGIVGIIVMAGNALAGAFSAQH